MEVHVVQFGIPTKEMFSVLSSIHKSNVLVNKFNEYFTSVGSLTAQKACKLAHVHNFCVSPEMPGSVSISADD